MLRVGHQLGVLGGVKELFSLLAAVQGSLLQKFNQDMRYVLFAFPIGASQRRVTIGRRVSLPWRKAAVALPGDRREIRIDDVEVIQHRAH